MNVQRGKLESDGTLRVPEELRNALGLGEGEWVVMDVVNGELRIRPHKDVVRDLQVVEQELQAYGNGLEERPRLVALNKVELLLEEEREERLAAASAHCGQPVLAISAAASIQLDRLLAAVWKELGI